MNLLTNFAVLGCFLPTPTEQTGFTIVFAVAIVFLLAGFINLKLYTMVLSKWPSKSAPVFWQWALLLCAGVLTSAVVLGFFTGTSEKFGTCKDGVWEGLQIPLMRVALTTTVIILIIAVILGFLFLVRLLVVLFKKIKSGN